MPGPPPDPTDKDSIARARRAEYDASVDKRLTVLETRFDVILPTLATKADLADLRADLRTEMAVGFERIRTEMAVMSAKFQQDMNKSFQRLVLWTVGVVITSGFAFFAATITMTSMMFDAFRDGNRPIQVQSAPALLSPSQAVPVPPVRR